MISLKEESASVQSLKDEFTQRIADTERKAQLACKERDIAKKVSAFLHCGEETHTRLLKTFPFASKALLFCLTHMFLWSDHPD